jgi:hypothetical protein
MGDTIKTAVAGVIAIGMVAAFGIHASGLSQLGQVGFRGADQTLGTAERG